MTTTILHSENCAFPRSFIENSCSAVRMRKLRVGSVDAFASAGMLVILLVIADLHLAAAHG
jgi:hypothetical protein